MTTAATTIATTLARIGAPIELIDWAADKGLMEI